MTSFSNETINSPPEDSHAMKVNHEHVFKLPVVTEALPVGPDLTYFPNLFDLDLPSDS